LPSNSPHDPKILSMNLDLVAHTGGGTWCGRYLERQVAGLEAKRAQEGKLQVRQREREREREREGGLGCFLSLPNVRFTTFASP
jgi:hypothetical protein